MLFARSQPPSLRDRIATMLWPRRSVGRSLQYWRWRLIRLSGEPHRVALGLACGVFVATLPVIGVQTLLAVTLTWLLGGNLFAAFVGLAWANPLTVPLICGVAHVIGATMLGIDPGLNTVELAEQFAAFRKLVATPDKASLAATTASVAPLLKTIFIGSIPLGLASAAAFYYGCRRLMADYRARRRTTVRTRRPQTGYAVGAQLS